MGAGREPPVFPLGKNRGTRSAIRSYLCIFRCSILFHHAQLVNVVNKSFLLLCYPGVVPELSADQKKARTEDPQSQQLDGSGGMGPT